MKRVVFCAVLVAAVAASAQAVDPLPRLYEQKGACLAVKDAAGRSKCLEKWGGEAVAALAASQSELAALRAQAAEAQKAKDAASVVAAQEAAKQRLEPAWRAFTALRAGTEAGISYLQYGQLVVAAATEVAHLKANKPSDREMQIAGLLDKAIEAHNDARTWWDADIRFYARRDNSIAYGGGLPFKMAGLEGLVERYSMPTRNADLLGFHPGVARSTALSAIWRVADEAVSDARKLSE